jgi:hypothetical protein
MNDRDREAFILSEGREPTEADEKLFEAFLPEGSIGRFGLRYGMFNTDNGLIYNVFSSCLIKYRIASDSFSASDFHPYMSCVTKRSYYRPTDEIWSYDGVINCTGKIKKYFNYYASSLYAVCENCRSFAIDLYSIGCDIEGLAGRSYFIFPAGSGKAAGLVPYAYGLRRCGVVTSDDKIRIFSGDAETASLPKAIIPSFPDAVPLSVNDPQDFNAGYLTALSEVIGMLTPYGELQRRALRRGDAHGPV